MSEKLPKLFCNSLGSSNLYSDYNTKTPINIDFRSNYTFNTTLAGIEVLNINPSSILELATNLFNQAEEGEKKPKGIPKNPDYKSLDEFCNLPSSIFSMFLVVVQVSVINRKV